MQASLIPNDAEAGQPRAARTDVTGFIPVMASITYLAAALRPAPRLRLVPSPIDLASVRRCSA